MSHVQTFGTMAAELVALREWLKSHGVTHVAMESTGVYWKPVWAVLEGAFSCLLVNAAHVKQVPGRKTDVLEDTGIKLASVATDIVGVPGRAMLEALVQGSTDPAALAELARGRLRAKLPALRQTLAGRFRPHHAFLVSQWLTHLDYLDEAIRTLSARLAELTAPFAAELARLDTIPGVGQRTAEVIIAELGVDMRQFPTDGQAASWAGLCPGNHESAGKHKSGRTRKGNRWLRAALTEAAQAAIRTASALAARYRRLIRPRGHKKAVVAMLVIAYHLLSRQTAYRELGADYFDRRYAERVTRRAIQMLERQGYRVTLEPAA